LYQTGSVPEVCLLNQGELPILLPEGEILVGAKQNRVINITILAAAKVKTVIPVSCVERGRWQYRSERFASRYFAPPTLRMKKTRSVHRSRRETGQARSDQGEVWAEVSACQEDLRTSSPTDSFTDSYEKMEENLSDYRKKMEIAAEASGLIVMKGEQILGIDLFDCASTFQHLKPRILDGYFMDALRDQQKRPPAEQTRARRFLAELPTYAMPQPNSIGLGVELRLESDHLAGCSLWYQGKVRHLSAFGTSGAVSGSGD